ncbi:MAG: caspase family protein [Planctomycetes bacterium]|nr:caspase family protein [Planctomycetota bacterium]
MPKNEFVLLAVPGTGLHPPGGAWEADWRDALETAFAAAGAAAQVRVEFASLDDVFAAYDLTFWDTLAALGKLGASAAGAPLRGARGARGAAANLRWTAGMVVQWVADESLRAAARARLTQRIAQVAPDAVLAHSLGSLVAYDTFTAPAGADAIRDRIFVSLGSQIGHPFVAGTFAAGRIQPLPAARHWYHLYNEEDAVFTAEIHLAANNFDQVLTPFDVAGIADHAAVSYLGHPAACDAVWSRMVMERGRPALFCRAPSERTPAQARGSRRLALLVGINDYPDESMRLAGCVNDVFLMSALLQEGGYEPDEIRVLLDERATAHEIAARLDWLLDGARDGDERVFYYSGHGAQVPAGALGEGADRLDETLVPWDFDWTSEHAYTDDAFHQLYSQIDYGCRFLAVFDCCHSGGLTRAGAPRIRGINPPDDIRHATIRWSRKDQMWLPRTSAAAPGTPPARRPLGQARALRVLPVADYYALRAQRGHEGPFMPVLLYACRENEFAFEYCHGSVTHGAFTYSLVKNLRQHAAARRTFTYLDLREQVARELRALGHEQQPEIAGPEVRLSGAIPFPARRGRKRRAARG